jgi:hypothetical protein
MDLRSLAKEALRCNFPGRPETGYTSLPEDNLLSGVTMASVEKDLRQGDGDELGRKFCAVHSSCALAVNCFGPFKEQPSKLHLLGKQGASEVTFEHKLKIFARGKGPNLDVWINRGDDIVAVESKFLEYLSPKGAAFSSTYERLAPAGCDSCWWRVYQEAKNGGRQHLDRAQLVKHYFGLNALRKGSSGATLTLFYIFWEPLNWQVHRECEKHRQEVSAFADAVQDSHVRFRWATYNDLWEEWSHVPDLSEHAHRLKIRYQVELSRAQR